VVQEILIAVAILLLLGAIWLLIEGVRLFRTTREWVRLFRSGADSIELVSVEPPKGFIFRRDATVTLSVTGKEGETKLVDQAIPIPIPQAFLWRVAGRVPTPIGRITEKRMIGRRVWRRRRRAAAAHRPEPPE
jgi:hypothetical protein